MYAGIKYNFTSLCYNAVWSVRRFDIILMNQLLTAGNPITGFDRNFYLHKIICFILIQIGYVIYIYDARPHTESIFNILEFVNEYLLIFLAYIMLSFTNLITVADPITGKPMPSSLDLSNNC